MFYYDDSHFFKNKSSFVVFGLLEYYLSLKEHPCHSLLLVFFFFFSFTLDFSGEETVVSIERLRKEWAGRTLEAKIEDIFTISANTIPFHSCFFRKRYIPAPISFWVTILWWWPQIFSETRKSILFLNQIQRGFLKLIVCIVWSYFF